MICTKVRDGDKRIVRLKEGSPKGRHVVIVDDLVQSGGTLIECQRLLKTQVPLLHTTLVPLMPAKEQRALHVDVCEHGLRPVPISADALALHMAYILGFRVG